MNTRFEVRHWNCVVLVTDGRCPDGCCGDLIVTIVSPVTGRALSAPMRALPAKLYGMIQMQGAFAFYGEPGSDTRKPKKALIAFNKADLESFKGVAS